MKKFLCILLSLILISIFCGCNNNDPESINLSQEVTIVKMPSPPICKTTDDISIINEVITILSNIEKSPINNDDINGGWNVMIKLKIDGKTLNYTIGGVFTDSDGKQYHINNLQDIEYKINDVYDKIDAPEVNYP